MMEYQLNGILTDLVQHAATSEATVPNDRRDSWWRNSIKRVLWKHRHGYRFTGSIDDPVVGSDEIDGIFKKLNDALNQFHEKLIQSEMAFHEKINTELHPSDLKIPVDRCAAILLNQGRSTRFVVSSLFPEKGPDRASVDLRLAPLVDHGDPAEWNAAFHHEWVGYGFRKARFTPLRELLKETTRSGQIGRERFFLINHDGIDTARREVVLHKGEADVLRSLTSEILKNDVTFVFCGAAYKSFDLRGMEVTSFGEAIFNFEAFTSWILNENGAKLLRASAGENPNHDEI